MPTGDDLNRLLFQDFSLEIEKRKPLRVIGEHSYGERQGRIITERPRVFDEPLKLVTEDEPRRPCCGSDAFANACLLTDIFGSKTCDNTDFTTDTADGFDYHRSAWFKWVAPSSGPIEFNTFGTVFADDGLPDTVLAVFTGTSLDDLVTVDFNDDVSDDWECFHAKHTDDVSENLLSQLRFDVVEGTTYYICVAGFDDSEQGPYTLNWVPQLKCDLVGARGEKIGHVPLACVGGSAPPYYSHVHQNHCLFAESCAPDTVVDSGSRWLAYTQDQFNCDDDSTGTYSEIHTEDWTEEDAYCGVEHVLGDHIETSGTEESGTGFIDDRTVSSEYTEAMLLASLADNATPFPDTWTGANFSYQAGHELFRVKLRFDFLPSAVPFTITWNELFYDGANPSLYTSPDSPTARSVDVAAGATTVDAGFLYESVANGFTLLADVQVSF